MKQPSDIINKFFNRSLQKSEQQRKICGPEFHDHSLRLQQPEQTTPEALLEAKGRGLDRRRKPNKLWLKKHWERLGTK